MEKSITINLNDLFENFVIITKNEKETIAKLEEKIRESVKTVITVAMREYPEKEVIINLGCLIKNQIVIVDNTNEPSIEGIYDPLILKIKEEVLTALSAPTQSEENQK